MASAFPASVKSALLACYAPDEISVLEHQLALPADALHIRVNSQRSSRKELLAALGAHERLEGFDVGAHPLLWDVLVIRRRPCAAALAPYIKLDADGFDSVQRFIERKRRGLPPHEVFVDRICGEAILKGADVFVKGVRAASMGLTAGSTVTVYVDLDGRQLRGSVCDSLQGMRLLGVGECLLDRSTLFKSESGLGVRMAHVVTGDLPALRSLGALDEQMYVQSLPSLCVAHVLDAQPGERVIDMCAAPGSKCGHVATNFLKERAGSLIVAVERNHGKLAKMKHLLQETFGLRSVEVVRADSCAIGSVGSGRNRVPGVPYEPASFDRVLLDPPCSALGLRPRLVQSSSAKELATAAQYQRAFLWSAVRLLKVGGTLVYSTCTLAPAENEGQVAWALGTFPCLRLVAATPKVGSSGRAGCGLSQEQCALVQRFEPSEGHEGFFIAKFELTCLPELDERAAARLAAASGTARAAVPPARPSAARNSCETDAQAKRAAARRDRSVGVAMATLIALVIVVAVAVGRVRKGRS